MLLGASYCDDCLLCARLLSVSHNLLESPRQAARSGGWGVAVIQLTRLAVTFVVGKKKKFQKKNMI